MTPAEMREFVLSLNSNPPELIVSYVQPIYELARFAEREKIAMVPQKAILTSAGTLYPYMREKIEAVFKCKVFDRYGCREVGDIACECDSHRGLHVFPWGSYVEIVDDEGRPVPKGTEGNIVVTSLINFAMPLVRYFIEDRGILSAREDCTCGRRGQIFEKILGRTIDVFRTQEGAIIGGEYFANCIRDRSWVLKFQAIQRSEKQVIFKFVSSAAVPDPGELEDIRVKTRAVMGDDCDVDFEFVADIPTSASGKYRYIISDIQPRDKNTALFDHSIVT
jgi:phenylacetate-CoA ligase